MAEVVTSDGVRLHVREHVGGHDGAASVLLVGGYTAPGELWALQVPPLVRAGHRVLVLDRRSHGRSQDTRSGQRMARHGMDLLEVVAALQLRELVVVGASMGASTMWAAADLDPFVPVAAWVSVDQTPKMLNEDGWEHGFYGLTPEVAGTFFGAGIPATGHGPGSEVVAARESRLLSVVGSDTRSRVAGAPETRLLLRDHALQDWRDVLAGLRAPAVFLAGGHSEFWPAAHATACADLAPRGRAELVPAAGHVLQLDAPDAVTAAVLRVARGVAAS